MTPIKFIYNVIYYINEIYVYMTTTDVYAMAFDFVMTYSKCVEYTRKKGILLYNTNNDVKYITDHFLYFFQCAIGILYNFRIEPMDENWLCSSVLLKADHTLNTTNQIAYIETYDTIESITDDKFMSMKLNDAYQVVTNVKNKNDAYECMVMMKIKDKYVHYCNKRADNSISIHLNNDMVKPCFLSIEYTHPKMKNGVILELNKGMYHIDNILFSPIFVKRLLEYQTVSYYFDMDYKLNIMDNNVMMFSLSSNQSVRLTKSNYDIICDAEDTGHDTVTDK